MGLTSVEIEVRGLDCRNKSIKGDFLVDSGATLTVLPENTWKALGIGEESEVTVCMADGRLARRKVGSARIKIGEREAPCQVILGETDDSSVVGVVTLEQLGFSLDPLKRKLNPMPVRM